MDVGVAPVAMDVGVAPGMYDVLVHDKEKEKIGLSNLN